MSEHQLENYILEQAKIEVEHTRSWPTKVMAFYVAINFGLIGSLLTIKRELPEHTVDSRIMVFFFICYVVLAGWVVFLLIKNHQNYLRYRNIQVAFQKIYLEKNYKELYGLPDIWFEKNKISITHRFWGWGFYLYIVFMITLFILTWLLFAI